MADFWILHNSQDEVSRNFISSLPQTFILQPGGNPYYDGQGNQYCVLDWYSNENERFSRTCPCHQGQPHFGAPPSAFPEIHVLLGNDINSTPPGNLLTIPVGTYGYCRIRLATSITQAVVSGDWDTFILYGQYLGGQTPTELQTNLLGQPWAPSGVASGLAYLQQNPTAPQLPVTAPVGTPIPS